MTNLFSNKVKAIFDNNGQTFDRYTVIFDSGEMLGLSENPNHPQGFSQWCGNCVDNFMFVSFGYAWRRQCDVKKIIKNKLPQIIKEFESDNNLGKKMSFKSLSQELKNHILQRSKDF